MIITIKIIIIVTNRNDSDCDNEITLLTLLIVI